MLRLFKIFGTQICTDKRRLVQTACGEFPARYTKMPTCYMSLLAEGETNFLFNPC